MLGASRNYRYVWDVSAVVAAMDKQRSSSSGKAPSSKRRRDDSPLPLRGSAGRESAFLEQLLREREAGEVPFSWTASDAATGVDPWEAAASSSKTRSSSPLPPPPPP